MIGSKGWLITKYISGSTEKEASFKNHYKMNTYVQATTCMGCSTRKMLASTANQKSIPLSAIMCKSRTSKDKLPINYHSSKPNIAIWEFLLHALHNPRLNPKIVQWVDEDSGYFKAVDKEKLVTEWKYIRGKSPRKSIKEEMKSFDRAIRYHYRTNYMKSVRARGVYGFGQKSRWFEYSKTTKTSENAKLC